jgi:hypothetical protein
MLTDPPIHRFCAFVQARADPSAPIKKYLKPLHHGELFINHRPIHISTPFFPRPASFHPFPDRSPAIYTRTMEFLRSTNRAFKCLGLPEYEQHLRSLPILFATPAIALYAADLRSYEINSNFYHYKSATPVIIDAVALTVLSITFVWSLVWSWAVPHGRIGLPFVAAVDVLCTSALEAVADTTLSTRTSPTVCQTFVDPCSGTSASIIRAAAGLTIVTG